MLDAYIGTIIAFAGDYEPEGWKFCNGQELSIEQNYALYSLIKTTYGGDGINYFNLPNLKGRLIVGAGKGTGLTNRSLGETGGSTEVMLTVSQLPAHNHKIGASRKEGVYSSPEQSFTLSSVNNRKSTFYDLFTDQSRLNLAPLHKDTISMTGGGHAHPNEQPYLEINYIICVAGPYPHF